MKYLFKCTLALMFFLLLANFCPGQSTDSGQPYLPVKENGKWGYVDQSGNVVIQPKFDEAAYFSEGWAKVKKGKNVFFINVSGKTVLEPDVASVQSFSEGLAVASKLGSKKMGYINKKGIFIIKPQFMLAYAFSEGKAAVKTKKKAGFGYIEKQGKLVIKPQFDGARKFVDGLAPAQTGGFVFGRWGYIDTKGSFVIKPQYEDALPFSEGLAAVNTQKSGSAKENTWGYINPKGKMAIKPQFDYGRSFSGGLAPVKYPSGWEFVDTGGKYVFSRLGNKLIKFADPFKGNLARVTTKAYESIGSRGGTVTYEANTKEWAYVDKTGKKVWPKPKVVEAPKPDKAPNGFTAFKAGWPATFVNMVYPNGWTATDLYNVTGFMKVAAFVKSSKASDELFNSKKIAIDHTKKIRMLNDDNIIIMISVHPEGGSDFTPKYFIKTIQGSALNNEQKGPIKTYMHKNSPVALRKITGTDADGKDIIGYQLATKRWGHMVNVLAYMPPASVKSTQRMISTMLDNMNVVDK